MNRLFEFKMEVSENVALLNFYKLELDRRDSVLEEYLNRIADLQPAQEELHKQRHSLREKSLLVEEMKIEISDSSIALQTERERNLEFRTEIDKLRALQVADRKRMHELLALVNMNNGGEVVSFSKDNTQSPSKTARTPSIGHVKGKHADIDVSNATGDGGGGGGEGGSSAGDYFATLQMYRAQQDLLEYKKISQEKVAILYDDRAIRESQYRQYVNECNCNMKEMEERANRTEERLLKTTQSYLQIRHEYQMAARQQKEDKAQCETLRKELREERHRLQLQFKEDSDNIRKDAETRIEETLKSYKHQVLDRENDLLMIREQYVAVQRLYSQRLTELSDKVRVLKRSLKAEQRRRRLSVEGYEVDLRNLRQEVLKASSFHSTQSRAQVVSLYSSNKQQVDKLIRVSNEENIEQRQDGHSYDYKIHVFNKKSHPQTSPYAKESHHNESATVLNDENKWHKAQKQLYSKSGQSEKDNLIGEEKEIRTVMTTIQSYKSENNQKEEEEEEEEKEESGDNGPPGDIRGRIEKEEFENNHSIKNKQFDYVSEVSDDQKMKHDDHGGEIKDIMKPKNKNKLKSKPIKKKKLNSNQNNHSKFIRTKKTHAQKNQQLFLDIDDAGDDDDVYREEARDEIKTRLREWA